MGSGPSPITVIPTGDAEAPRPPGSRLGVGFHSMSYPVRVVLVEDEQTDQQCDHTVLKARPQRHVPPTHQEVLGPARAGVPQKVENGFLSCTVTVGGCQAMGSQFAKQRGPRPPCPQAGGGRAAIEGFHGLYLPLPPPPPLALTPHVFPKIEDLQI